MSITDFLVVELVASWMRVSLHEPLADLLGGKIDPVHNLLLCHSVTKHVHWALNNISCRIRVDK